MYNGLRWLPSKNSPESLLQLGDVSSDQRIKLTQLEERSFNSLRTASGLHPEIPVNGLLGDVDTSLGFDRKFFLPYRSTLFRTGLKKMCYQKLHHFCWYHHWETPQSWTWLGTPSKALNSETSSVFISFFDHIFHQSSVGTLQSWVFFLKVEIFVGCIFKAKSLTDRIHGAAIFAYIYHKNQPFM